MQENYTSAAVSLSSSKLRNLPPADFTLDVADLEDRAADQHDGRVEGDEPTYRQWIGWLTLFYHRFKW